MLSELSCREPEYAPPLFLGFNRKEIAEMAEHPERYGRKILKLSELYLETTFLCSGMICKNIEDKSRAIYNLAVLSNQAFK